MTALVVIALAALFALATWAAGWWGVVIVSLIVGATWRHPRVARLAALAASLAWSALLVADATGGRLGLLSTRLGGIFRMPGAALLAATLLFAALLAWSAAAVAQEIARLLPREHSPAGRKVN